MEFLNWFLEPVRNQYADFEGRTSRKEFWMFVLVYFLLAIVSNVVGVLGMLFFWLAIFVPSMAIIARRLHDTNKSGWWQIILSIPHFFFLILFGLLIYLAPTLGEKGEPWFFLLLFVYLLSVFFTLIVLGVLLAQKTKEGPNRFDTDTQTDFSDVPAQKGTAPTDVDNGTSPALSHPEIEVPIKGDTVESKDV